MKRKIIIIDDETDQKDLLILSLAHKKFLSDYEFIYTSNGYEALELLVQHKEIDIALVDINMPEMDGLTLLNHIRVNHPRVQSIMISAYSDMSNIRIAMNRGAYDFVTKPIDLSDLEFTIKKTLLYIDEIRVAESALSENLSLKQRASELEMQALRAQMNPHFIFNSLNSINNYILNKDQDRASDYLLKFSKLIRLILQNSTESFISIDKELEALKLYIELEALRFMHKFNFELTIDKDLDTTSIKVPPLILQPFVENAINHGLIPKQNDGELTISAKQEGEKLIITISDNGIGRTKASEIKSHNHKSMGIKMTTDRIRIMQNGESTFPELRIDDLINTDNNALGTKITIQLPILI